MTKRKEFTPKTKLEAFQIFKGRCAYCKTKLGGKVDPTEYDHKYECWEYKEYGWDTNDLNSVENCLPCHRSCHSVKSKKSTGKRAKGRRQTKKYNGGAAGAGGSGLSPVLKKKSQWQSRPFDKPPKGFRHWG